MWILPLKSGGDWLIIIDREKMRTFFEAALSVV